VWALAANSTGREPGEFVTPRPHPHPPPKTPKTTTPDGMRSQGTLAMMMCAGASVPACSKGCTGAQSQQVVRATQAHSRVAPGSVVRCSGYDEVWASDSDAQPGCAWDSAVSTSGGNEVFSSRSTRCRRYGPTASLGMSAKSGRGACGAQQQQTAPQGCCTAAPPQPRLALSHHILPLLRRR